LETNKTIATFGDVIQLFKREIEIRNDNNMLESIFHSEQKKLGRKFNIELIKLEGKTFYTDVSKFKEAISKIFEEIRKRDDFSNVIVQMNEPDLESYELKIIHLDSFPNRSAKDMSKEINDGDFKMIKENLQNLCDWSIESNYADKAYRVNYFDEKNKTEELEDKCLGFTHVLRFYK
jgi:hypothetical protein